MGGGLLQLVAYGAQDVYLTGDPQITYFKTVYRRHTNFSMESIEQVWCGDPLCGRATSTLSRNGDLIYKLYLQQTLNVKTTKEALNNVLKCCGDDIDNSKDGGIYIYNPTHTGIDNIEIEIGGQLIDRHTGKWMEVYSELTEPNSAGILGLVGSNGGTKFQNMARAGGVIVTSLGSIVDKVGSGQFFSLQKLLEDNNDDIIFDNKDYIKTKFDAYVPLRFWFCRNPGLALPLIALQYHEVKINLELNKNIVTNNALCYGNQIEYECNRLFADYIYLDTDERRRFAQISHEYLIEQVQYQNFKNTGGDLKLNFNHPVKEIIWTGGQNDRTGLFGKLPGSSTDYTSNDYYNNNNNNVKYNLNLNGQERMSSRPLEYYTKQQVYDYHTGNPVGSGDGFIKKDCCLKYNTNYIDPHSHKRIDGTINKNIDEIFNNVLYLFDNENNEPLLSKRIYTERSSILSENDSDEKLKEEVDFALSHNNYQILHIKLDNIINTNTDNIYIKLLYDTEDINLFTYEKDNISSVSCIKSNDDNMYIIAKNILQSNYFYIKENVHFNEGEGKIDEVRISQPIQFITSEEEKVFNNKTINKSLLSFTPSTPQPSLEDGIYFRIYRDANGTTGDNPVFTSAYKLSIKEGTKAKEFQVKLDNTKWNIEDADGVGIYIGFENVVNNKSTPLSITLNYGIDGPQASASATMITTDIYNTPNDITTEPNKFTSIAAAFWVNNGTNYPYFNVNFNGSMTDNYFICYGDNCENNIAPPGVDDIGNISILNLINPILKTSEDIILASTKTLQEENPEYIPNILPNQINKIELNNNENPTFILKNYLALKDDKSIKFKEIDITTNILSNDCNTKFQKVILSPSNGKIVSNVSFTLPKDELTDKWLYVFNSDIIEPSAYLVFSPDFNIEDLNICKKGLSNFDPEKREYVNTKNCKPDKSINGNNLQLDKNSSYLKINFSINDCLVSNLGTKAEVFHFIKEYIEEDKAEGAKTFVYSSTSNKSGLINLNNSSGQSVSGLGILLTEVEDVKPGDGFLNQFIPLTDSHIIKIKKNATYTSVRTYVSFIPSSSITTDKDNPNNRYWPQADVSGIISQPGGGAVAFPYFYFEWDYDFKNKTFFPDITNVDSFSFPVEMTLSVDNLHVPGYCGINVKKANSNSILSDLQTKINTIKDSMDNGINLNIDKWITFEDDNTNKDPNGLIIKDNFNITDNQNVSYTFITPPNKSSPKNFKGFLDYFDDYIKLSTTENKFTMKNIYLSGVDITKYNCVSQSDKTRIIIEKTKGKKINYCEKFTNPASGLNGNNIKRKIYRESAESIDQIVQEKGDNGHIIIGDPKKWLTSNNKFIKYSIDTDGNYNKKGEVSNCSSLCGSEDSFLRFEIEFNKPIKLAYYEKPGDINLITKTNVNKFSYWLPFELINNNSINIIGNDVLWNKFIQVIMDNTMVSPKNPSFGLANDYWKFFGVNEKKEYYSYNENADGLFNQFIWAPNDKSVKQVGPTQTSATINDISIPKEDYDQLRPDTFCNIFITSICRGVIHLPNIEFSEDDKENVYKSGDDIISNLSWDNPNIFYGNNNSLGNKVYGIAGKEITDISKDKHNIKNVGFAQAYHMYSRILHDNAYDRRIYALSFDDTGDRASYLPIQFDSSDNKKIDLKVNVNLSNFKI